MQNMTRKKIEFEVSSGNVFADLGIADAEELYTRAALGVQVMKILTVRELSQKEAADMLGIRQPEVSAIMRARFRKFSQERLIGFLNKLNQKVTIQVSRRRKGEPYQQVTVAP
jgi:predicted XRE-type DNA-binding protein